MDRPAKFWLWPGRQALLLVIILSIGAALRFYGLFRDRPYFFNPDEKDLVEWGREFEYLNSFASEWGATPLLIVKLIEQVLSIFLDPTNQEVYTVVRILAVLVGCAIILLVFLLGREFYSRRTAIYAAIFTALTVLLIQYSHFYSLDLLFAFFVLVALFPILSIARRGFTKYYIMGGIMIGLTATVRINGYFLLLPLLVSHFYATLDHLSVLQEHSPKAKINPSNRGPKQAISLIKTFFNSNLLVAGVLCIVTYLIITPASILDTRNFLFHDGLVWVLLQSSGFLKSRYTLQFEGTTPDYYFLNLLFWSAGPLLLIAYVVGVIYGVINWRARANIIILSFVVLYLWSGAGARVKFIRYCLPLLPLLNLLAAYFFASLQDEERYGRFMKWGITVWFSLTLVGSAIYALAFTSIYAQRDPRIIASDWIRHNIPPGATIARGSNDYRGGLLDEFEEENAPTYQLNKINFDKLYESSPPAMESHFPAVFRELGIEVTRRGKEGEPDAEFTPLSDEEKWRHIGEELYCADYVIFTERNFALYQNRQHLFPVESSYYTRLFAGDLGFQLLKVFDRKPTLFGWQIDDSSAELTFHLFDHPTVWIFQAQPSPDFIGEHPPQYQRGTNWDNKVRLIGYDLSQTKSQAGRDVHLTLYWETLNDMNENYTIFVHLQDSAGNLVAQRDHQVADGILPTSCWHPGRVIVDKTTLAVSSEATAGPYQLKLGLYAAETLERLPILNDSSGENALYLADLQIVQ